MQVCEKYFESEQNGPIPSKVVHNLWNLQRAILHAREHYPKDLQNAPSYKMASHPPHHE